MANSSNPTDHHQLVISNETAADVDLPVVSIPTIRRDDSIDTMDFNPFACISSIVASVNDSLAIESEWFSDADSDSERDVSCFVTDLFDNRRFSEQSRAVNDQSGDLDPGSDPFSRSSGNLGVSGFEDTGDFESNYMEELWSTFAVDSNSWISETDNATQAVDSISSGLRNVDEDSDSDSDRMVGVLQLLSRDDDENDINWVESSNSISDNFCFQDHRVMYEDFEWEEVEERVDERENLREVVDGAEELSVTSGLSDAEELGEEAGRNLEWEILLVMNNIERNMSGESGEPGDSLPYLAIQDDYTYAAEYDTLFGQFVENENSLKGSPPAAKSVVENLPLVELKTENMVIEAVVCAVCKDKISLEERVRKLPCCHYYHDDCILPWLNIRNTCPVCRFELPTDDPDYERRKSRRAGSNGLQTDLQIRYNFEVIA